MYIPKLVGADGPERKNIVFIPKSPKVGTFNRDYERAKGSDLLDQLRIQRGMNKTQLAKRANLFPSEVFYWCIRKRPVPKTERVMKCLSNALEVPQDLLWEYLTGKITLADLPPSKAQMKSAIPDSWVKALYPIAGIADHKTIAKILRRLSAKVLSKK